MSTFTVTYLKSLPVKKNAYYVVDSSSRKGTGRLKLKVAVSGKKTFYFTYYVNKKEKMIPLGNFPEISLSEARRRFSGYSIQLVDGIDPKERMQREQEHLRLAEEEQAKALKAAENLGSLQQLFEYHMKISEKRNRARHRLSVRKAYEQELFPFISPERKARDITSREIAEVIGKVLKRGATQANRVRSYLRRGFELALQHDNDPANLETETVFALTHNPVAIIPRQTDAEIAGERFLSESEIGEFLNALPKKGFSPLTRLTILLMFYSGGQRPYEIMNSKWENVDFSAGEWLFPTDLTKNSRANIVPISGRLRELLLELKTLASDSPYLIHKRHDKLQPGRADSLAQSFNRYCERTGAAKFTPCDIRRTCKTMMTRYRLAPKEILDRLHNHALNDVSNKHYNRHDYLIEKRDLLISWEHCLQTFIDGVTTK